MEKPLRRWAWGAIFHGTIRIRSTGAVATPSTSRAYREYDAGWKFVQVRPHGVLQSTAQNVPATYRLSAIGECKEAERAMSTAVTTSNRKS